MWHFDTFNTFFWQFCQFYSEIVDKGSELFHSGNEYKKELERCASLAPQESLGTSHTGDNRNSFIFGPIMHYNLVQTGSSAEVVWDVLYSEKMQEPVDIHNAFKPL